MMTPIILLSGKAGSGKDTAGEYIANRYNGITIGQADPMKRFAMDVFGFDYQQLWGPSDLRNAVDHRYTGPNRENEWDTAYEALEFHSQEWLADVLPPHLLIDIDHYQLTLVQWFRELQFSGKGDNLTPRVTLQTLGTNWGRDLDRNVWVDYANKTSNALLGGDFGYTRSEGLYHEEKRGYDYVIITDGRFRNEVLKINSLGGVTINMSRNSQLAQQAAAAGVAGHVSETELDTIPRHFFRHHVNNNGSMEELFTNMDAMMMVDFGDYRGMSEVVPVAQLAEHLE